MVPHICICFISFLNFLFVPFLFTFNLIVFFISSFYSLSFIVSCFTLYIFISAFSLLSSSLFLCLYLYFQLCAKIGLQAFSKGRKVCVNFVTSVLFIKLWHWKRRKNANRNQGPRVVKSSASSLTCGSMAIVHNTSGRRSVAVPRGHILRQTWNKPMAR
jgi:hypothetical protein